MEDASGVAGLLMLAQSFAHTRPAPDRSIAFVAFTAGEPDLLGSRYYVENPVIPLDQTAGAIDLDALRVGGRTRDVVILGSGNSELEESVRSSALLQGRRFVRSRIPSRASSIRRTTSTSPVTVCRRCT